MVNQIKDKDVDYIILGASTGLTTLNTKVIDSITTTSGINLAMDDTALSSQYVMLQHFLAQGKTTKWCILAPSAPSYDLNTEDVSDNDYRFLPFVNSEYVSNYYNQFDSRRSKLMKASKWVPMLGVSYYNTELFYPSLLSVIKPNKRNRFDDRGNYTYPQIQQTNKTITHKKDLHINFNNVYIDKIKAICKQHNIELICYFSPMEKRSVVPLTTQYTVINHSDLLSDTMYFYDEIHVNSKGRFITSVNFANAFKDFLD